MKATAAPTATLRLTMIFGALGYMSVLMQWLWLAVTVIFPFLITSGLSTYFLPSEQQRIQQAQPAIDMSLPAPLEIALVVAAVVFTLGVTMYALIAVPRTIGRAGKTLTQQSAAAAIPRLTHHRAISVTRRKALTEYITWAIKLIFVGLPLLALFIPTAASVGLSHIVVMYCGLFFGGWSLLMFSIQYCIAKLGRIDPHRVW